MATFTVNGNRVTVSENQKLLRYLRDVLHLTSVKDGCSEGACGSCTVLIDGKPARACIQQTDRLEGKSVLTVEGLSAFEKEVYAYAFGEAGAVQCGFCIPGMVLSAKGLFAVNPDPSEAEIAYALRNNICRCTGYVKIIKAVRLAAQCLREGRVPAPEGAWCVGARVHRLDVREKVLGTGIYCDDITMEGMLYGSAVRAAYPRARVLAIHTEEARALPGVACVLTAADIPGRNKVGHLKKDWDTMIAVGDVTHYLGDAIALVVAETPEILEKAKKLVKVDYEVLPAVHNPWEAAAEDAPRVSAKTGLNIDQVLERVVSDIPAPTGDPDAPLKALIFDSIYDSYKGVIVYIRVFEGTVKPGDTIRMMATGAEFTLVEVGHMGATNLSPCAQLQAGEVGYLTASIKTVQDTRVGDTVTLANNPTAEALPGYRQVKPMVFCGIYPADGAKYPDLKDALEKLQLNDASLTFELETSAALGFGFRCGFLGLLHMEIITERLEREFDLDIITTTPSVRYRLTMTDGTVEMIDNPSSYPDPSNIVKQEEPFVDVHLYTPNDYVGALMDLCQQKRGVLIDMKYLDDVRVDLHYALPLGEIVYDFFDAIKSRSRGYASYDYEFKEYRESDLVKLDFLLNGDPVDALSMIVFRDNAYAKGRRICEKLRDNIPRNLFEIPVQAAIGGKIIARETVKAMRKDVLAKCYGGDISRKKKLLEKQKEGKKKMRQLGSVELPSEAFTAVLKLDSDDD